MRAPATTAVLALALVACAQATQGFTDAPPDEVVLRVETGGGFVPLEYNLTQMPEFTLYGDGRIVTLGAQIEIYPQPALPPVLVRTVSADAIAQIVERAREAGLEGEDREYTNDMIADAGTTTFTLTVDADTHTTSAYALDFTEGPNAAERRKLVELRNDLSDLSGWIDAGEMGEETSYEAEAVRTWIGVYQPQEDLEQAAKDWPLPDDLGSYEPAQDALYACAGFDGADAQQVLAAARDANGLTPWRSGGDDYAVLFRPLLPDESGCPAG